MVCADGSPHGCRAHLNVAAASTWSSARRSTTTPSPPSPTATSRGPTSITRSDTRSPSSSASASSTPRRRWGAGYGKGPGRLPTHSRALCAQVPYSGLGPADVDTAAARQLALEAAQQSIVLLRNDASSASPNGPGTALLPLSLAKLAGKSIAVVGPNADAAWVMLANYHGTNSLAASHTPLRALQAAVAAAGGAVNVSYAVGCVDGTPCNSTAGFGAAVAAAQGAAVVLFFGGLAPSLGGPQPGTQEGEEFDRADLGMPGQQEALLRALATTGTSVVLVRLRGGPVALSDALYADNVTFPAVVDSPYPGELGGDALAAVLLGDVSPSGRLACTVYASSFAATRSIIDYNMTSAAGVTYQYYTGAPQWPLGWGLAYTTWQLTWLVDSAAHQRVDAAAWLAGDAPPPAWGVNVTNAGAVTSDVSVLAFVSSSYPGAPLQQASPACSSHALVCEPHPPPPAFLPCRSLISSVLLASPPARPSRCSFPSHPSSPRPLMRGLARWPSQAPRATRSVWAAAQRARAATRGAAA